MNSPDQHERLLDHAQDKIVVVDETGRVTYANQAVERLLGWAPSELVGKDVFEYVHPNEVERVRTVFERLKCVTSGERASVEYRIRAAGDSWVWVESRVSSESYEELGGYVVSSRDVSGRVRAERNREQVSSRLAEISAVTDDVLWMFDAEWSELLFLNDAYESVYGQPRSAVEADPRAFLEAVHPEDVPHVEAAMERLSAGESVDIEYRVNPERDYSAWVWVQGKPIYEDGAVVRVAGFTRDVTHRHRRERHLEVVDNFLRHNIRNDMNVIQGVAQLVEYRAPEAADEALLIQRRAGKLVEKARKERQIISYLTDSGRPTDVDVGTVVRETVASVARRHPDAELTVRPATEPTAEAEVLLGLQTAVNELLENAIEHAEEAPRVTVDITVDSATVTVTISDECPPIPEMERNVLVGEHEMSEINHSSGLGLWLVYWLVEMSNGRLTVDAEADAGNQIAMELPRISQ